MLGNVMLGNRVLPPAHDIDRLYNLDTMDDEKRAAFLAEDKPLAYLFPAPLAEERLLDDDEKTIYYHTRDRRNQDPDYEKKGITLGVMMNLTDLGDRLKTFCQDKNRPKGPIPKGFDFVCPPFWIVTSCKDFKAMWKESHGYDAKYCLRKEV